MPLRKGHNCSSYQSFGKTLGLIELICAIVFIIEILLKLIIYKKAFFNNNWNVLDIVIVCPSFLMFFPGTAL